MRNRQIDNHPYLKILEKSTGDGWNLSFLKLFQLSVCYAITSNRQPDFITVFGACKRTFDRFIRQKRHTARFSRNNWNLLFHLTSFSKLMDEDHILKVYNRVYKTIYARMKRGTLTADEFNHWKAEARHMLDKTRAGEIKEDVFETWLKKDIRAWGIGRATAEQSAQKLGED